MTQKKLARAARRMVQNTEPWKYADITVTEVARRFGVSISNLSHAYSACYSGTLNRWIKVNRFLNFNALLSREIATTVKGALEILDVRSSRHFSREFKAFCGCTPGRVCKEIKKIKERLKVSFF
ncbi:MAG: helix-turn-helix transcriptional regulator [bacterium]|nr:helix-turn-helix transcriptional regulator [bacterium]